MFSKFNLVDCILLGVIALSLIICIVTLKIVFKVADAIDKKTETTYRDKLGGTL